MVKDRAGDSKLRAMVKDRAGQDRAGQGRTGQERVMVKDRAGDSVRHMQS